MESHGTPWKVMEGWNILEHSMKFLGRKVYNKLTHRSKE
jgi:hypothetical protein